MKGQRSNIGIIRHCFISLFLMIAFTGCLSDKTEPFSVDHVTLKWHKGYEDDSFEKAITGLNWALSHIGAKNLVPTNRVFDSESKVKIYPVEIGLKHKSQEVLGRLHAKITQSEAYQKRGDIDMGHYVTLLLGSSEHYYALVDLPNNLSDLEEGYTFSSVNGYINNSAISAKHRVLKFTDQHVLNQLFISQEIDSITGEIIEFETLDLLPNGQPRFGIFAANGERIEGANPVNSSAGKPGKCMWCHESKIQPLFSIQEPRVGYLTPNELRDTLLFFRESHKNMLELQTLGVNFETPTDHVLMELLYIAYMEPSVDRLALEWGISTNEVENLLENVSTHEHEEFSFLGARYFRKDVQEFAPYQSLSVSDNVRELEGIEVNHLD